MAGLLKWMAAAAFVCVLAAPAFAQQAGPQEAPRCGGLFCDIYYSQLPAGAPVPSPGQPGSIFLPCHDFVCGMFGGRTPDQPVAVATEPAPVEPPAKPKRKHGVKDAAKDGAGESVKSAKADASAPK